jgi:hypothetical protein
MPDLSRLHTFGCRIYALSTRRHQGKVTTDNIICGKLLSYGGSMKNFIYINNATRKIGRPTHASFDEAQLSTPVADLNSNSLALWGALNRNPGITAPPVDEILTPRTQFFVFAGEYPFLRVAAVVIPIKCNFDSLGLILEEDPMSHRNIIADVRKLSSASQVDWQELLQFRTVIQVDANPVFSIKEAIAQFGRCDISVQPSVSLIFAPYRLDPTDQQATSPQVALDQLRIVHHVIHDWDLLDPILMVTAANSSNMAAETNHTHRTFLLGPDKEKWMAAKYAQLDKHHSYGMWGDAISRRDVPPDAKIVRPVWNYTQKGSGEHKARNCTDGKQLVRMGAKIGNTYDACMEQHCLRLFVALTAYLGNIIEYGDVVNAYAHAEA